MYLRSGRSPLLLPMGSEPITLTSLASHRQGSVDRDHREGEVASFAFVFNFYHS